MKVDRIRGRVLAVVVSVAAIAVFAVTAATAPAGGSPDAQLAGLLDGVNYQSNAIYTTTFKHTGNSQTHVEYHNPIPKSSTGAAAAFFDASCEGTLTATEFVCDPIKLSKGQVATVTIVWTTFASGTSAGCDPCMTNAGYWSSDSGTNSPSKPKKTTSVGPVETELLAGNDPARAGGFSTTSCTNPSGTPTIQTPQAVGASNPLTTSICAANLPTVPVPGIVAGITERPGTAGDPGVTDVSDICLPTPGVACGGASFHFPTRATFTFQIHNPSFFTCSSNAIYTTAASHQYGSSCQKVTKVFHDGNPSPVPSCTTNPAADPCVFSLTFSSGTKVSTAVVKTSENGGWDFG